ncbi:non-specific lipid transfer protein GPI-anchored 11-like isoform X2 [Carex rostrata]
MAEKLAISLLFLLNLVVMAIGADIMAPSPSVDCTPALLSLADCLTYVEQGSNLTKPEGDCCSGLKKVVKEEAHCLCEAFSGGSVIPLDINITKALALPSVCKVKTPPASKCNILGAPGSAPATAPSPAKSIAAHLDALQPTTVAVLLLLCFSINLSINISSR